MSLAIQKPPVSKSANYSLAGTLGWFLVVFISFFALLAVLAGPHFFGHHIRAGDIAEQDLIAQNRTQVVDEEKTFDQTEIARHDVLPVLKRDKHKSSEILLTLTAELERSKRLIKDGVLPLPAPPHLSLSPEEQALLLEISDQDFAKLKSSLSEPSSANPLSGELAKTTFEKLRALASNAGKSQVGMAKAGAEPAPNHRAKNTNSERSKNDKAKAADERKVDSNAPLTLDSYLAHLDNGRQKYHAEKSSRSNIEHKLLLLTASIQADNAAEFFSDTLASVQRLLENVSLHPYVDRHEWEMQVYEFLPEKIEQGLRHRTAEFVAAQLEPNVSVDQTSTEERIKEAVATVKPIMKEIDVGSIIVKKGETINKDEVKTLESLGITKVSDSGLAAAIAIALTAAYLLFGLYLHTYEPKLFFSPSTLALMATLSIITCVLALFLGPQFPQFIPLSATTLIFAVTYGRRLTAILTVLILLFLSVSELASGANLVALGAAAGMALGASVKRRRDLMVTSILVGCMQMVGFTSAVIIGGTPSQTANLGSELPLEMMGGLLSAIAAIGSLPFLEIIFGILTPYRIAELAEPDQPLMRQLEENAPGTYQHSLAVANLAEGGARAIGANVNLVHTGAMYHDIGKMVTPRYFIENQLGDKNPHDFIPPEESKAKVLAHVTNGLALAQKYGLPKAVQAFIPEHQGTTVMAYFYHKACMRDGAENVDPLNYRYPGPKPQTRESAIVMLADVSEAVTHSMRDPTMEEVDTAMSNVFKARWDDGQFDESGLTHDELEKVKRGFVRVWRTLHHDRLKYPATTTGRMAIVPVPTKAETQKNDSEIANKDAVEASSDHEC